MSKLNSNSVLSLIAIIVSFSALVVSIRETSIMKEQSYLMIEQQKTSVWPYVTGGQSMSLGEKGFIYFRIKNKGIGPAIIKRAQFSIGDIEINDYNELNIEVKKALPDGIDYGLSTGRFGALNEQVLQPNEEVDLIKIEFDRFKNDYSSITKLVINYDICYCSIYDDCWAINDYKELVECVSLD